VRLARAPGPDQGADVRLDAVQEAARDLARLLEELPDLPQTWLGRHTRQPSIVDETAYSLTAIAAAPPLPRDKPVGPGRPSTVETYPGRLAMRVARLWYRLHGPEPLTRNGRHGRQLNRGGDFVVGVVEVVTSEVLTPRKLEYLVKTKIRSEQY
jgi:hypothetical protein